MLLTLKNNNVIIQLSQISENKNERKEFKMVDTLKLRGKMVEKNVSVEYLAEKLCVDKSTLYRRLERKGETFTIKEANIITTELKLTKEEAVAIFFA